MKKVLILIPILSFFFMGCGSDSASNQVPFTPPPGATPITPGVTTTPSPQQADLTIVDAATLSDFAKWPLNNPTNVFVKASFNASGSVYIGSLTIGFQDSGYLIQSGFTTGGTNSDAQFNSWMPMNGLPVFRAFFEDNGRPFKKVSGGVVFVIDNGTGNGDGSGTALVRGSVWYRNFPNSAAPQATERCWFVSIGPYDCRAFLLNNSINMASRLYPDDTYIKLGTFSNLNLKAAFNQ